MNKKFQQSCQWDERRERPGRILVVALEGHHSVVRLGPLRATVEGGRRWNGLLSFAPYVTSYAVRAGERVHIVHDVTGQCATLRRKQGKAVRNGFCRYHSPFAPTFGRVWGDRYRPFLFFPKLECWGFPTTPRLFRSVERCGHSPPVCRTDGRTDGQTDGIGIAYRTERCDARSVRPQNRKY